jgi:hypothetical protein
MLSTRFSIFNGRPWVLFGHTQPHQAQKKTIGRTGLQHRRDAFLRHAALWVLPNRESIDQRAIAHNAQQRRFEMRRYGHSIPT